MKTQKTNRYTKTVIFYCLELAGSICNLLCSFLGVYPRLELGVSFLINKEAKKVTQEREERVVKKEEKLKNANVLVKEARSLDG